jgi:hypothetical protein
VGILTGVNVQTNLYTSTSFLDKYSGGGEQTKKKKRETCIYKCRKFKKT